MVRFAISVLLAGLMLLIPVGLLAQTCSLQATYASVVPDHVWQPDPNDPGKLNLMMHVKLCNPTGCTAAEFRGLRLGSGGTGNDAAHIDRVSIYLDTDCDGQPDPGIPEFAGGVYPADNSPADFCSTWPTVPVIEPGKCLCVLIYYDMDECAPAGSTFYFSLLSALTTNCSQWPLLTQLRSAVKTVGDCCLYVDKAPNSPLDHKWVPTDETPNEMLLLKLSNACCQYPLYLECLTLAASGTGDDANDISSIVLWDDTDCDGVLDASESSVDYPAYPADNGNVTICPNYPVPPSSARCLGIAYRMRSTAPCDATYRFDLVDVKVAGATGGPGCLGPVKLPIPSAIKTVQCNPCCLEATYASAVPDHTWRPDLTNPGALNLMMHIKVCNPPTCPPTAFRGLRLHAAGSGNDQTDIIAVHLFMDADCDGKPDSTVPFASGSYSADDGVLDLCAKDYITIQSGQCMCFLVYYDMNDDICPPVGATYTFTVESALGIQCEPICLQPALTSAKKSVGDCCLKIEKHPNSPIDHTWTAGPNSKPVNEMLLLKVTNTCCQTSGMLVLHCLKLKASGSGNDANDISSIVVWDDADCDGVWDSTELTMDFPTYAVDDGEALVCPDFALAGTVSMCVGIGYRMNSTAPCDATYRFDVTDVQVMQPTGAPGCADFTPPIPSAIKTVYCPPCCLDVYAGPANPPDHSWVPGDDPNNAMMQFLVENPCSIPATVRCLKLQPSGTGNDAADIEKVLVYVDTDCNGAVGPLDLFFGSGAYPADDTATTICGGVNLPPSTSQCFLVVYVMKSKTRPGSTYKVCLTDLSAVDSAGNQVCVNIGTPGVPPICGGTKTRCWLIGEAKCEPLGTHVCLPGKVSTARFRDRYYIEEKSRAAGIAVLDTSTQLPADGGVEMDVSGITQLVGCEVVIIPDFTQIKPPYVLGALGMNGRAVGGGPFCNQPGVALNCCFTPPTPAFGLNNVGLLIRIWGRVTYVAAPYFWVDDGSGRTDGQRDLNGECVKGIRVDATQAYVPKPGSYVIVTGISRADSFQGPCCASVVSPRVDADVVVVPETGTK